MYIQTFSQLNVFRVRHLDTSRYSITKYPRLKLFATRIIHKCSPTILTGADYSESIVNIVNIPARFYAR